MLEGAKRVGFMSRISLSPTSACSTMVRRMYFLPSAAGKAEAGPAEVYVELVMPVEAVGALTVDESLNQVELL